MADSGRSRRRILRPSPSECGAVVQASSPPQCRRPTTGSE